MTKFCVFWRSRVIAANFPDSHLELNTICKYGSFCEAFSLGSPFSPLALQLLGEPASKLDCNRIFLRLLGSHMLTSHQTLICSGFAFLQNAAGHFYSRSYGFGVLNANSLIEKAKEWRHVPQQLSYEVPGALTKDSAVIPSRRETVLKVTK